MKRLAETYLTEWQHRPGRKPLVIRGARQVGKTYLVQHWGREHFASVVTVDLERERELHSLFDRAEPRAIIQELALLKRQAHLRQFAARPRRGLHRNWPILNGCRLAGDEM